MKRSFTSLVTCLALTLSMAGANSSPSSFNNGIKDQYAEPNVEMDCVYDEKNKRYICEKKTPGKRL